MTVKELVNKLNRLHAPSAKVLFTTPGPGPETLLMFNPSGGAVMKYENGIAWVNLRAAGRKK